MEALLTALYSRMRSLFPTYDVFTGRASTGASFPYITVEPGVDMPTDRHTGDRYTGEIAVLSPTIHLWETSLSTALSDEETLARSLQTSKLALSSGSLLWIDVLSRDHDESLDRDNTGSVVYECVLSLECHVSRG